MKQGDFAYEWFRRNPGKRWKPEEIRLELSRAYQDEHGKQFADPGRYARLLARQGHLQRSKKGTDLVFWYDPQLDIEVDRFTDEERSAILERDGFRCSICKKGAPDGVSVSVGYAVSERRGGKLDVENGRTLCDKHRFILQTAQDSAESATNFRRLQQKMPKVESSSRAMRFWEEFLELLGRYGIDPTR